MSTSTVVHVAPTDTAVRGRASEHPGRRTAARALVGTVAVVAFWYGATGALLALEHSATTRVFALALAIAAAASGLALTRATRAVDGARAAARAVLAGALLWTCVSTAFYSGWVVGPTPAIVPDVGNAARGAPSLDRAVAAIAATSYSTVLAACLLVASIWLGRSARRPRPRPTIPACSDATRYAPATFATLWAAHELAKLNVFVGVASPGAAYLPAYLAHLRQFFGPPHNSSLLLWSVVVLGGLAALLAGRALAESRDPARRTGRALLAGILALAALEHAMLGTEAPPQWWSTFVAWRGHEVAGVAMPPGQATRPSNSDPSP